MINDPVATARGSDLRSQIVENQSQWDSWVETVRYGVILIEEAKGAANGQNYFQRRIERED